MERTEQKLEQWSYSFVICEICNNQANISNESCNQVTKITKETHIFTILSSVTWSVILWISNRRVTNLMTSSRLCIAQLNANTNLIVNCVLKHLKDIKHILRECRQYELLGVSQCQWWYHPLAISHFTFRTLQHAQTQRPDPSCHLTEYLMAFRKCWSDRFDRLKGGVDIV